MTVNIKYKYWVLDHRKDVFLLSSTEMCTVRQWWMRLMCQDWWKSLKKVKPELKTNCIVEDYRQQPPRGKENMGNNMIYTDWHITVWEFIKKLDHGHSTVKQIIYNLVYSMQSSCFIMMHDPTLQGGQWLVPHLIYSFDPVPLKIHMFGWKKPSWDGASMIQAKWKMLSDVWL